MNTIEQILKERGSNLPKNRTNNVQPSKIRKVMVKYLPDGKGNIAERYLIESESDIDEALKVGLINGLHLSGMRKYISNGECVILNKNGGYSNMRGTWEFVNS